MEQLLVNAANGGQFEEVQALLADHPGLNVNWGDIEHRMTALHWAPQKGHLEVVKLLLAHHAISVNVQNSRGSTPFSHSCYSGSVAAVRLLLKDPRVDVTLPNYNQCTPLWRASYYGRREVIEWLIASGRDLGDLDKKGKWSVTTEYSALEIAKARNQTEVVALLERFIDNPTQTRHELRLRLGVRDELAAEVFALTVFLCDGLLQPRLPALAAPVNVPNPAARFFAIARKLPLELQMVICHRAVGSAKDGILNKDSEAAFKSLARILLVPAQPLI